MKTDLNKKKNFNEEEERILFSPYKKTLELFNDFDCEDLRSRNKIKSFISSISQSHIQ